ncbi:MAG: sulfotransferase [Planctomycetes bacterium]|nr:sulfotransferase [Planctomycetota bacterium]
MIDRFVLLIGAMKAGTTTLFELLAQHPQIAPCRDKEPDFLAERERWRQGLAEYSRLWDWQPGRHRYALEASTKYTKLPAFPSAAIATSRYAFDHHARFRFIYLVRHPIARLRSEYLHSMAAGWIREPIELRIAPHAVMHSNYHLQLHPYVVAHGRESIAVVTFDELKRDPAGLTQRLWRWLELDERAAPLPVGKANAGENHRERLLQRLLPRCGGDRAAALREVERAVTPSAEQAAAIRRLLERDLAAFRDDWGIDPWALQGDREGRTAGEPAPREQGA